MRKSLSKIISIGVICAMIVLLFAACGSKKANEGSSNPSASNTAGNTTNTANTGNTGAKPIKFSYMLPTKFVNWLKDLAWYPELKKRTNAEIDLIPGGDGTDYTKNVDLKMASGDLPDAMIVDIAQAEVYGNQGAFTDLKPLIDQYAPSIKKYLDNNPDCRKLITSGNGKIYGLPQEYPLVTSVAFYREDMFKKAEITAVPRTIEELTAALTKLKDTYKTTPNFYPLTGRDNVANQFFTAAFHAQDTIDANGKIHGIYAEGRGTDIYSEGYKEMIQWYRDMYAKGLIDPEWVTGAATEESWQTKMLVGKGAMSCDFFTRPAWFMSNGGPQNDPDYSIKTMPPLLDKNGNQTKLAAASSRYRTDRIFAINAKSQNAVDIIKFLDYLYSDEGMDLLAYGIEGTTYKVENGKKVFIVNWGTEAAKPLGTINYGIYQDRLTFPTPCNDEAYYEFQDPLVQSFGKDYFTNYAVVNPTLKYSKDQLEERSNLVAKINEALNSYQVKFIKGDLPMSEWDNFLKDMERMGYKRVTEIDQAAYDALQKQK